MQASSQRTQQVRLALMLILVHLQNRFQVMSYSGDHETSHLCS